MNISTHILDIARGLPATGVTVSLERLQGTAWTSIRVTQTDSNGRAVLLTDDTEEPALFRLRFETAVYFHVQEQTSLYPYVEIVFTTERNSKHYHVPLLLAANGYTTYRGS